MTLASLLPAVAHAQVVQGESDPQASTLGRVVVEGIDINGRTDPVCRGAGRTEQVYVAWVSEGS